jgi:hypothetical protein
MRIATGMALALTIYGVLFFIPFSAPESITFLVAGNLAELAPDGLEPFLDDLEKQENEITSELPWYSPYRIVSWVGLFQLSQSTGIQTLHVKVTSSFQTSSGAWVDRDKTAVLSKDEGAITKGELLFLLHRHFHEFVRQSDHVFPEELELKTVRQDGVPVYSLFLGS